MMLIIGRKIHGSFFLKYIPLTKASLCALICKVFVHCTNYVNSINLAKRKESKEMKVLVKLAMLVTTLLLIANISFASSCDEQVCYAATVTYEDGTPYDNFWKFCLNDNGTGDMNASVPLHLFGDSPLWSGFDKHPRWTTWILRNPDVSAHFWTDIYGMFLNGEGYTGGSLNTRWKATGIKVPCP